MTDRDFLLAYQRTRSPELFAEFVASHIDLVYSVARRNTGNAHIAEDIVQEVFLTFMQKAPRLKPDVPLAGWLFTTTRLKSLHARRSASRRIRHETESIMPQEPPPSPDPLWPLIAEEIDQAVDDLPHADRHALLLRYFNHHSTSEIAAALAISEDAVHKRLQRALAALQKLLTARGHSASAIPLASLASTLASHAVHRAPPALASTITQALLAKTTALTTKGVLMASAKSKIAVASAVLLATFSVSAVIYVSKRSPSPLSPASTSFAEANDPASVPSSEALPDDLVAYGLKPDQFIAVLPNVDPALRDAFYKEHHAPRFPPLPHAPPTMIIRWQDDQPFLDGTAISPGDFVSGLGTDLFNTYSTQTATRTPDEEIMVLPGDVVYRTGGTPAQYLADLQTIYTDHFKRPVTVTLETPLTDAIVLSGHYHFTHAENARYAVHFYLHNVDKTSPGGGGNSKQFARTLSSYLGPQPVVIESPNFPKQVFFNFDSDAHIPLPAADIPLFLQRLTEQTGLTATHEKRPIPTLIINATGYRLAK